MARKECRSQQANEQLQFDFGMEQSDLFVATNDKLLFAAGHQLALIDENGSIVKRGSFLEKALFRAVSTQLVKHFHSHPKRVTDADF